MKFVNQSSGKQAVFLKSRNGLIEQLSKKGTGELTKNRNLTSLATTYSDSTNLYTHTELDDVTEVVFTFTMLAGTTIPAGASVQWLPDGLNEASRTVSFAQSGGANVDVEYARINLDDTKELRVSFTSFVSDIAFLPSIAGLQITSVNQ